MSLPRIAALCGVALIAPVTLWVEDLRGGPSHVPAIALACALPVVLTTTRMVVLVAEQRAVAVTDSLTGLHTRRFLEAKLAQEVARVRRSGGTLALFILDVDHFKSVNDSHGHPAGDRALVEIARRLDCAARTGDLLARYGGEEFALLSVGGGHQLAPVAERLRRVVARNPIPLRADTQVELTVSIGAAGFPEHGSSPAELIDVADQALYAAKDGGRNRAVIGSARPCQPGPEQPAS